MKKDPASTKGDFNIIVSLKIQSMISTWNTVLNEVHGENCGLGICQHCGLMEIIF